MLTVEIDSSKLEKALRIAPVALRSEVADTIDHITRSFLKRLYRTRFQGPPGLRMGGRGNLFSRIRRRVLGGSEGSLSHRIKARTVVSEMTGTNLATEDMGIEVFSKSPAAVIHETGGTISHPGMPIPFPGKRLTQNLMLIKIGGRLFLGRKKRSEKKTELVAILKNKIHIRPRLGCYMTWDDMEGQSIERLNSAINRALAQV